LTSPEENDLFINMVCTIFHASRGSVVLPKESLLPAIGKSGESVSANKKEPHQEAF